MLNVEDDPKALSLLLPQITAIADGEKDALGFLPPSAFADACSQHRLVAAVRTENGAARVAGYILFGGIYPRARVYQVAVSPEYRRSGVAKRLVAVLVARLEAAGYLSLSARVAKDLPHAIAFYTANGFALTKEISGGASRARKLLILARRLTTVDLLSRLDAGQSQRDLLALALRSSAAGDAPFYVIDLNVLFDLIRDRGRSKEARRLFAAALAHRVRLVVSPEFLVELRRTTLSSSHDPVLEMALQLPQLVPAGTAELRRVAETVHSIVFVDTRSSAAGRPQSLSDSMHVAHSALSKASAFITSDGQILSARDRLRNEVGIDVASLDELLELIPIEPSSDARFPMYGKGFDLADISAHELQTFLRSSKAPEQIALEFGRDVVGQIKQRRYGIRQGGRIVAVSALSVSPTPTGPASLLLYAEPTALVGDLYYDALFDRAMADATSQGPVLIELRLVPSDTSGTLDAFARSRGFLVGRDASTRFKVALGRSITATSWRRVGLALERRTGLSLSEVVAGAGYANLSVPGGQVVALPLPQLDDFLGPAAIAWPGRGGVIQPITSRYADELLGTGAQRTLLDNQEAAFLSRRCYASSPRSAQRMSPGSLIFFYESQRTGGRGAIVAVARIVDALTVSKEAVSHERARRLVVTNLSNITRANEVLLTTFDNLLAFPRPCPLATLRKMGAVGAQNLQTTTTVSDAVLSQILDFGWADEPN